MVIIVLVLLMILMYAYIKRPWKKGYLYVKDNGKIMRGRSYPPRSSFQKGKEARIENKGTSDTSFPAQKEEKSTSSKFDFLFGKKDDEK